VNQPFVGKYRARCVKVVDGDTIDALVDVGFHVYTEVRLRLWGIDTPEMNRKEERDRAVAATEFVRARLVLDGWPLYIETLKDPDSFGRFLAKVWYPSDGGLVMINDELVSSGHAVEYRR
jgi:micrococcal nuclease